MNTAVLGVERARLLLVHAAPIEGHGLEDLGVQQLGVGKVASAVRLQQLLARRDEIGAVVLFGIVGAFPDRHRETPSSLGIGDVVVVREDRFGDEGVVTPDGFLDLGAMRLGDVGPFAADRRLLDAAVARLGVPPVTGVTVSSCSGRDHESAAMHARSGADVESMEGAAVAFVCRQHELPLLQLRAVSNWTGDRDQGGWRLGDAVASVQRAVRALWHG